MRTDEKSVAAAPSPRTSGIVRLLPPEPGQVLDGRFLVLDLLCEGGTSRVLRATDLEHGDLVALKVPKEHFAQDAEFLERFLREEEIGLRARHRYLVAMRPVPGKTRPYLAMEYVKGETLARRLSSGPRMPAPAAAHVGAMILRALEELHRLGVVHRDVTPQNVMLCEDGTIRLLDYGIASSRKGRTAEEWTWGTPAYMAPEQVRNESGDPRTDLYALGVVLYEMTTGSVPFVGDDPVEVMNARLTEAPVAPRTLAPDLDPVLERIILRALQKHPRDRYRSARSMRGALESLADRGPGHRLRTPGVPAIKAWLRKYWAEASVIALLGALLAKLALAAGILSP